MKLQAYFRDLFRGDRAYRWKVAALIGVIAALISAELYHVLPHEDAPQTISCPNPIRSCQFTVADQRVELRFSAPPSGLHPFTIRLLAPAARIVYASFTMRGMDMGFNRYRLLSDGAGTWHAPVLLPACVTGRRDWLLTLTIDDLHVQIPFNA